MIDGLSHLSTAWSHYFGAALVQNTVFLIVVFVVLRALKNASAQTRYLVAVVGLFKLLIPPFIPLGVLSSTSEVYSPLTDSVVTLVAGGQQSAISQIDSFAFQGTLSFLFLIWIATAVAYFSVSLVNTLRLSRLLREATPVDHMGMLSVLRPKHIRLLESDRISMPLTVGVFPTKIFLPTTWRGWSPAFRNAVMRHEVAHITRFDGLIELAQALVGALYFFHPLVWVLNKRLRTYREMACDDSSVCEEWASRLEYSRHLAEIAETSALYPLAHGSVSALLRRKNEILARVRYQTKEGIMRSVPRRKLVVVLALLVCCVVSLSWQLDNPAARESTDKGKDSSPDTSRIKIDIRDAKTIRIGEIETKLQKELMAEILGDLIEGDPDDVVFRIRCPEDLPMSALLEFQGVLIKGGFTKVSFENGETTLMPLILPSKHLEEKMKSMPREHIADVCVCAPDHFAFDGKKVSVEKISQSVKRRLKEDPSLIVSIIPKPEATYGDFLLALKEIKSGGAQRIVIKYQVH